MDLSNLSSNLPPSTPVTQAELNQLDAKLTNEFKNAANSVAALYRLSNSKNSLLRYKGYLDCLDDLLNIIKLQKLKTSDVQRNRESSTLNTEGRQREDPGTCINEFDIENWCLTKKAELMGGENINEGLLFSGDEPQQRSEMLQNKTEESQETMHSATDNDASNVDIANDKVINNNANAFLKSAAGMCDLVASGMDFSKYSTYEVPLLPENYEFTCNHPVNHRFRPSMPLLSVHNRDEPPHNRKTTPSRKCTFPAWKMNEFEEMRRTLDTQSESPEEETADANGKRSGSKIVRRQVKYFKNGNNNIKERQMSVPIVSNTKPKNKSKPAVPPSDGQQTWPTGK